MSTKTVELTEAARHAIGSATDDVHDAAESDQVDGVQPALVARPTSTDQVSEVMKAAAAHEAAVVVRGRGTKLTWGRPPERADLVVDLSGLDRVLDHVAGDLIVETQAGTRLSDLQGTVAESRQRLAVDETVAGASVGGTVTTNASGPGRLSTGTIRDLLIGITMVRADGVVAKAGGRVVKNVAGYDIGKLVTGSFGTLAIVTEAFFRLHPSPAERRFVSVPVDDATGAGRLAQVIRHSQIVPAAVELDWPGQGAGVLGVALEGIAEAVESRSEATQALLGSRATGTAERPTGWGAYPWPVAADGDDRSTAVKLTFALSGLVDVLDAAQAADPAVALRGSAGAGVMYGAIPSDTDPATVDALVERLRAICVTHGGSLVVLDAPAAVKDRVDTWGPIPALDLMRRVKAQFDPDRRLAPGRFVGGI